MKRVHILVSGTVQGVSFRYYTKRLADDLEITGWVRNLFDGRVEIVAEGEKLSDFIKEIERGPVGARVSNLQICEMERGIEEFVVFEIRRTTNF